MPDVSTRHGVPQYAYEDYERDYAGLHTCHGVIAYWAARKPDVVAIVNADTGVEVTWQRFEQAATAFALKLLDMGFKKGDFFATSLPMLTEHIFLEYACFKIGVIYTPLDLRLKGPEVIRSLTLIKAKGYAFLGKTPNADFGELGKAVQATCPFVEHLIQFAPPDETIPGAKSAFVLAAEAEALARAALADPTSRRLLARSWPRSGRSRRTTARWSSSRPAPPAIPSPPCSRTGTSRCRICAWARGSGWARRPGCWSTCRRRTSAGRRSS